MLRDAQLGASAMTALTGHSLCEWRADRAGGGPWQTLLAAGASPHATDEDGSTPLHDAAASGCSVAVGMLLSAVASEQQQALLKAADADGDTPLHNAARGGHTDVVTQLLEAGSSPLAENSSGKTPDELADPDTEAFLLLEMAAAVARQKAQSPASLPSDIHSGG
eukprot:SM000108S14250  [mRNA]  locus=s108:427735:429554:- [translate_table: standard]